VPAGGEVGAELGRGHSAERLDRQALAAVHVQEGEIGIQTVGVGVDGAFRGPPLVGEIIEPGRERFARGTGAAYRTGHRSTVRSTTPARKSIISVAMPRS
jgi:hypothetical protein